ncbi:MAG: hypothetical protein BGO30_07315 [Bacteroidetes bacterium 41-46]|nr:MAG: hypothetical protein BGO30_07315 [Bacteroidetes bacterium 41-46]
MTPEEFFKKIKNNLGEIKRFIDRDMPRVAGKLAVDHYKDSFRNQGFTDKTLAKWQPSKRTLYPDRHASSQYGTLLSARNELMEAITYRAGLGFTIILNDKEYAEIHNEGGPVNINVTVTPKMRKFAWAKHFSAEKDSEEAAKWKGMALTKKSMLNIKFTMPQRQFIGESEKLNTRIADKVEEKITNLLNNN